MDLRYLGTIFTLLSSLWMASATAAIINVTNPNDSGSGCNLRDAIRSANADAARGGCTSGSGADTIRLTPTLNLLESALPTINTTVTIESVSANVSEVRGNGVTNNGYRIFDINNAFVTLNKIEVRGGKLYGILSDGGGGIRVGNGGLTLNNCIIRDNLVNATTGGGGAILASNATLTINDTVINNNSSESSPQLEAPGAGIRGVNSDVSIVRSQIHSNFHQSFGIARHSFDNSDLTVDSSLFGVVGTASSRLLMELNNGSTALFTNSTLSGAPGLYEVGGVRLNDSELEFVNSTVLEYTIWGEVLPFSGTVNFTNTIFTGYCYENLEVNATGSSFFTDDSCTGAATVGDLRLLPLDEYGGPTGTVGLHPLSHAINRGANTPCPATDQRGELRDGACDIGAFEYVADADIQISVVPTTPAPYYVGQNLLVNINLENDGPDSANFIHVDLEFQNLNVTSISGACGSNPCEISSLTADAPARTIIVAATVLPNAMQNWSITATASKAPQAVYNETNPANNVSTATRNLVTVADLTLSKTLITPPPYSIGQSITHQIVLQNLGPAASGPIVMTETPENLTITSISGCSNQPAGPCNIPALGSGGSITYNVTSTITATRFNNAAQVSSGTVDPFPANNIDDRGNGGSAEANADIKVGISRTTPGPYYSGKYVEYVITVKNLGPGLATNVQLEIDTDNYFITGYIGSCGPTITPCAIGNLATFAEVTITLQGSVTFSGPASVSVYAGSAQSDTDPLNNAAINTVNVQKASDIQVSLNLLTPPPYTQNQVLRYRMITTNLGDDFAHDVVPIITPTNLQIVSAIGNQCLELPCTIPLLSILETETIEIQAFPIEIGVFDMSASASANEFDPFPGNNTDAFANGGIAEVSPIDRIFADGFEVVACAHPQGPGTSGCTGQPGSADATSVPLE